MRKWQKLVVLVPFSCAGSQSFATESPFKGVVDDIKAVCTQPATQGQHWKVDGNVNAEAGIQLKLLKVAGVAGTLSFTKEEWSGIQRVLSGQQASDNKDYRECVKALSPVFLGKLDSLANSK